MLSGQAGQPGDGVAMDADEPAGLPGAVALGEVVQHRAGLVVREMRAEERGALALGEAVFAGPTVEEPDVALLAEAAAHGEVAGVALAVEGASGVLAAEASQVVHGSKRAGRGPGFELRNGE
jgi:hypothetical protein